MGSNITLSWTNTYPSDQVRFVEWYFTKFGGTEEHLAESFGGGLIKTNSSLPGIIFKLPSTLILNNVTMDYNGTYAFIASVRKITEAPRSEVEVIILGKNK